MKRSGNEAPADALQPWVHAVYEFVCADESIERYGDDAKILVEIQIHDRTLHNFYVRLHRFYAITRATGSNDLYDPGDAKDLDPVRMSHHADFRHMLKVAQAPLKKTPLRAWEWDWTRVKTKVLSARSGGPVLPAGDNPG